MKWIEMVRQLKTYLGTSFGDFVDSAVVCLVDCRSCSSFEAHADAIGWRR